MNRDKIYAAITEERERQHAKGGKQEFPLRHGKTDFDLEIYNHIADRAKKFCNRAVEKGWCSWELILQEELAEVLAAETPEEIRTELTQLAAVCVQILEGMK